MIRLLPSTLSILVIAECSRKFCQCLQALVNCIDWVEGQKISCTDQILTALSVSRIVLLWVILLNWYATMYYPAFYCSVVSTFAYIVWIVNNHFSVWLATSLSILYLLKIANFSSLFFLHLKWKAERVVLMILFGSLGFLVCHLAIVSIDDKMQMHACERNATWGTNLRDIVHLSDNTAFTIVHVIPFTMSVTTLLLLLFSLWKHLKKMQLSGKRSRDASTKVHVRAMQTVISFPLVFFIYCLVQITSKWNSNSLLNNSVDMFCQVLGFLYFSSHSFILIWGNKKLRLALLSLLLQLRCWLKEKK
ncbi:taste receptor type 2 member 45-like [Pteronotus mesoamericanus]|uniref:taste receptor type 2 member 45-like n=1 Tax=Pteronotus mesoamericanus TaxID=1884717 RepID=UPI0023EA9BBE|nr:taste receptor type 2 member 45-like [Pteronotus parnellii mesoamericanus]